MKKIQFYLSLSFILCLFACSDSENNQVKTVEPVVKATSDYSEKHRPQFHFSPIEKWMNDPNGMVFYEGEYHLFYQYYPEDIVWGPMHWGHAVSTNLIHWEHLPIGLYPDSLGYIFSGSAVVDWNNTSGFGQNGKPPLIALFTHHDPLGEKAGSVDFQNQSIAYSNDKGRSWTKYAGNPVIANPGIRDFRDPKVIWDAKSNQWIMVFAAWDHVKFYGSANLKEWQHLSDFGKNYGSHAGVWECPDLFPIKVKGTDEEKWVLLLSINPGGPNGGSGTQYFVGDFNGTSFTLDPQFASALGDIEASIPNGKVFQQFENGYGDWVAEGTAFGEEPTKGSLPDQQRVEGGMGAAIVNSFHDGDQSTGTLTSPFFTIEKDYINFKIGGGNDQLQLGLRLLVAGEVVRTAVGSNTEKMKWAGWKVAELKGKTAQLQIVDAHTGAWGHVLVDQIMFSEALATPAGEKAVWLDWGRDNYAGVTWSDIPNKDGRRLFMGWMSNWDYAQVVPTESWRSAMTLPRSLELQESSAGLRLVSLPVKELEQLRKNHATTKTNRPKGELPLSYLANQMEVSITFEGAMEVMLLNEKGNSYSIGYDPATNTFFSDRTKSGNNQFSPNFGAEKSMAHRLSTATQVEMHLFFDHASVELFADGGSTVLTEIFFPDDHFTEAKLIFNGKVINLDYWELEGIW